MLRFIKLFTLSLFLTACAKESILLETATPIKDDVHIQTISKITIPVREHGYQHFKTILINSQESFNIFLDKIQKQKNWNQKTNFLSSLKHSNINFKTYNLLLYRITEASGSTILSVDVPKGNKENINIKIEKNTPQIGTADMAYYALAYKISKSVKQITFRYGKEKDIIKNSTPQKEATVPKDCMEWYDGCNNCGRVGEKGIPVCTERYCIHQGEFKCTKWKVPSQ